MYPSVLINSFFILLSAFWCQFSKLFPKFREKKEKKDTTQTQVS